MKDDLRTIDLTYVLFSVLKKWKVIVAAAFLGMVLAVLWGFLNPNNGILAIRDLENSATKAQIAYEAGDESVYEELVYSIAEKKAEGLELEDADMQRVEIYANLVNDYYTEKSRAEHSYYMQIDEKAYYEGVAKVYFRCNTIDLYNYCLTVFDTQIARQDVKARMAEAGGVEDDLEAFTYRYPYGIWHDSLENTFSSISVSNELDNALDQLKITKNVEDGIIFTCSTIAATEETAEAMLQVGIEEIESIFAGLKTKGYDFDHEMLLREVRKGDSGALKAGKDEIYMKLQEKYEAVLEYKKNLTQMELKYYEGYYALLYGKHETIEAQFATYDSYSPEAGLRQNQVNELIERQKKGILVKLLKTMILFTILSMMVSGIVYALRAVLVSIRTFVVPKDVETCFETKVLACVHAQINKDFFGYFKVFRNSKEYAGEMLNLMGRKFVLTGDTEDTLVRQSMESIAAQSENVSYGEGVANSIETLDMAKKSDGVVIMIVSEKTRRETVAREWKACEAQGIPVHGMIMLR